MHTRVLFLVMSGEEPVWCNKKADSPPFQTVHSTLRADGGVFIKQGLCPSDFLSGTPCPYSLRFNLLLSKWRTKQRCAMLR